MLRRFLSCALAAAATFLASSPAGMAADELLTVGSEAPALNIEHWVHDGNGKYKPVTKFDAGKVYVVEFWATWCGPCRMCMPHLAETQTKYADKVQIVSVSDEDLETVESFLKSDIPRRGPAAIQDKEKAEKIKTYNDLTSVYCLTTDPDKSVYEAYMDAAVQQGIPTCFIVGKDRKIEWIGHPMEMDEPLEQVLADKWDRKKFGAEFTPKQEAEALIVRVNKFLENRDVKGAMAFVESSLEKVKGPASTKLRIVRLQLMLGTKSPADQVADELTKSLAEIQSDPASVNELVWNLVAPMEQGVLKKDAKMLELMLPVIKAAAEKGTGDDRAMVMDSLAHVQNMTGDVEGAIKTEKAAIEMSSPGLKEQLKAYLQQLETPKKEEKEKEKE